MEAEVRAGGGKETLLYAQVIQAVCLAGRKGAALALVAEFPEALSFSTCPGAGACVMP